MTGRPRRIRPLNLPMLSYAARVGGFDRIALTMMDALGYGSEIPVITGYEQTTTPEGMGSGDFDSLTPQVTHLPGWRQDEIQAADRVWEFPDSARAYLYQIENHTGTLVEWVSHRPWRGYGAPMSEECIHCGLLCSQHGVGMRGLLLVRVDPQRPSREPHLREFQRRQV